MSKESKTIESGEILKYTGISLVVIVSLSIILTILFVRFLDHECLYDPYYLVVKSRVFWVAILFSTIAFTAFRKPINLILRLQITKKAANFVWVGWLVLVTSGIMYTGYYYGGYGYGACSKPSINKDYYRYPGQTMYLDEK